MASSGITFDQFLWAISVQESGGANYRVVNKYGAVGKYQVLKSNIPGWSRAALGYTITWQKFRDTPALQERIVRHRMRKYWDAYGARGAASAWYSGNPSLHMSTRPQPGGPSIKKYVDDVLKRAAGAPGGGSGTSGGKTAYAVPRAAVTPMSNDELAEAFGFNMRLINSSKELKDLLARAQKEDWGASETGKLRFLAALKNTKWWLSQSSTLRKYITLRATDPKTWTQNRQEVMYKLNALAVQIGLGNQIKPDGKPTALLDSAMYNSLALGWADQRLKDWFGARVNLNGEYVKGEAGEIWDKLHELTYLNGLKFSDTWMKNNTRSVISGKSSVETLESYIRKTAASRFKAYAEQIKAGVNVMDLAAPYIKVVSSLLELPETGVDLFDSHISKAMTGGSDGKGYSIWEFENIVRSDPLWNKTNNARESMFGVAHQVLKDFGALF